MTLPLKKPLFLYSVIYEMTYIKTLKWYTFYSTAIELYETHLLQTLLIFISIIPISFKYHSNNCILPLPLHGLKALKWIIQPFLFLLSPFTCMHIIRQRKLTNAHRYGLFNLLIFCKEKLPLP